MDNINATLSANILKYRKRCGFTQDELAEKLGVTFQAVSKWENGKSAPDISLLPIMADLFACSIDSLFSRESTSAEICYDLPWKDDGVIRGAVFEGRSLIQDTQITRKFTFEIIGEAKGVSTCCDLVISGNVSGGCSSHGDLTVGGNVSGGCAAKGDVTVGGDISSGCAANGDLTVAGSVSGGCRANGELHCEGNISGDVTANSIACERDITAHAVYGNVICALLKCDLIEGSVTTKD